MKHKLLLLLLSTQLYSQPEPVREFKIYSSNDQNVLGNSLVSGYVKSAELKDLVSIVLGNKDSFLISDPVPSYVPKFFVSWQPNAETDIDHYLINYWKDGELSSLQTIKTKETRISVPHILNVPYKVTVRAVNKIGLISPPSSEVSYIREIFTPVAPIIIPNAKIRYINVQMSIDGGTTYKSIGKIPYPPITGQKYKTTIITE